MITGIRVEWPNAERRPARDLGEANVRGHTLDRLATFAERAFHHRLTYRQLTQ